jgi:hypothetical protein
MAAEWVTTAILLTVLAHSSRAILPVACGVVAGSWARSYGDARGCLSGEAECAVSGHAALE